MRRRDNWRFLLVLLLLNAVFLWIGTLFEHPLQVTGWWVWWIVTNLAALAIYGTRQYRARGNRITLATAFGALIVTVNVAAAAYLFVGVPIAASMCDADRTPDGCNFSLDYTLGIPVWIAVDILLGIVWLVGRAIGHGVATRNRTR